MKYFALTIFVYLFLSCSFGQLVTTVGSASNLVQNVLLGPGVTVSNIQYNGGSTSIGSFGYTGTNFGIKSGIIMTTGTVINNGNGPQGPNNNANAGFDNGSGGLTQLSDLVGGTATYNAAVLQFDFIPYSDTVRFKYSFASEEYPEYVGSKFNDVFAFFISGPGISGQQNIAKLPNGTPVTINNVNATSNSAFFIDNGDGTQSPYNSSADYIQYDGFTRPLEAVSKVQCGQKYHLVIAIADVGDGKWDSGIFLEANSLQSKTPIDITSSLSFQAFPDPNQMAEGCVKATVTLKRNPSKATNSLTIPVLISGTASQGTDYTPIPTSITFPAGQSQVQFTFDALSDALTEGVETIKISFQLTDPCGNVTPIELNFSINDVQPVSVTIQNATVVCPGDPVQLVAIPSGGTGPYTFNWSTGALTQNISVSPSSTAIYTVTIKDNCLNQTATTSSTVVVPVYPALMLNQTPDITEICPYTHATLEANATGGAGKYKYQWSTNLPSNLGKDSIQDVLPGKTTLYTILVTDQCGTSTTATINFTITSPPLVITISPNQIKCPEDSALISVSATGGYGQYYYKWNNGNTNQNQWVKDFTTTTYKVSVSDDCQTFSVDSFTIVKVIKPNANFQVSSSLLFNNTPITFENLTSGGLTYFWTFGDGNTSTIINPNNTYLEPGSYEINLYAKDYLGCKDSTTRFINIEEEYYIYVPNTFTPDGNRVNNEFQVTSVGIQELSIAIFNRWGEIVYSSDDINFRWNGTYKDQLAKEGTYTYTIKYVSNSNRHDTIIGHVNLLR